MVYPPIQDLILQRPPFLFVDEVISFSGHKINTIFKVLGTEDFFKGHFPQNPIMPGVLLQEALLQSGAALIACLLSSNVSLGVVTKIQNARFKNIVRPNEVLEMEVELVEKISNASYMKGLTKVNGKIVLSMEFTVASINS